jgi:predicted SprT family Zn-dependent metalloprotease
MPDKKQPAYPRSAPSWGDPIGYDRYFRVPIIMNPRDPNIMGQHVTYNVNHPDGKAIIDSMGYDEVININPNAVRQSYRFDEDNEFQNTMKHELVHVLQDRLSNLAGRGKRIELDSVLNPLKKEFWTDPAMDYEQEMQRKIGRKEGEAYMLNNDVPSRDDLPQNPAMLQQVRQRYLQKLRDMGLGKYVPIWERR